MFSLPVGYITVSKVCPLSNIKATCNKANIDRSRGNWHIHNHNGGLNKSRSAISRTKRINIRHMDKLNTANKLDLIERYKDTELCTL